jgi:hypothetical protein
MAITRKQVARKRKRELIAYARIHNLPIEKGLDASVGKFGAPAVRQLERTRRHLGLEAKGGWDAAFKKALKRGMTPLGARAATILEGWAKAGWKEQPPGSNKVPQLATVARNAGLSDWYQRMGWPWCMFAAILAAFLEGSVTARLAIAGKWNGLWTVAMLHHARAGEFGMRLLSKSAPWPRGTFVLVNFPGGDVVDHVFVLRTRVVFGLAAVIELRTVEGNTSLDAAGSQSNGGAMALRIRRVAKGSVYGIEIT